MKFARFASAGLSGALALVAMNVARAEVVTIAPDGTVERSENVAAQQPAQYQNNGNARNQQATPQYDLATPEAIAGMPGSGRVPQRDSSNNRDDRNNRDRDHRDDRDHRNNRDNRYRRPGGVTIIGNNNDIYLGGRPGYSYGYPYGIYYGNPYYGNPYGYYGGNYGNGVTITYGNGLGGYYGYGQNIIAGQSGMGAAWPNMGAVGGLGSPFGTVQPQPRLPSSIYNPGRRR
jgi:hypothetical protein